MAPRSPAGRDDCATSRAQPLGRNTAGVAALRAAIPTHCWRFLATDQAEPRGSLLLLLLPPPPPTPLLLLLPPLLPLLLLRRQQLLLPLLYRGRESGGSCCCWRLVSVVAGSSSCVQTLMASAAYHLGAKLGEGSFGTVFKAVRRADSSACVIKQVSMRKLSAVQRDGARNEVALLRSLEHPRVVRYIESFVDSAGLNIVMEWAARGDLQAKIRSVKSKSKRLTEQAVFRYFLQITQALDFIHARKILHRDLKPANIFLDEHGDAKLGDFGVSKLLESTTQLCDTTVGTPFYFSPELCEGRTYSSKSDIWALGCVLYELCELAPPFTAKNMGALVLKIVSGQWSPLSPDIYCQDLAALVEMCLTREQSQRPSAATILAHPMVQAQLEQLQQRRPETPASPDNDERRQQQRQLLLQEGTPLRSDVAAARVYGPKAPRTTASKLPRTPIVSKHHTEAKHAALRRKERQLPPQRQRMPSRGVPSPKRNKDLRPAGARIRNQPLAQPHVDGGKAIADRASAVPVSASRSRERDILAVRDLPDDPMPHSVACPTSHERLVRQQAQLLRLKKQFQQQLRSPAAVPVTRDDHMRRKGTAGDRKTHVPWTEYADVLPTDLVAELRGAQASDTSDQCKGDESKGRCQKETNSSPAVSSKRQHAEETARSGTGHQDQAVEASGHAGAGSVQNDWDRKCPAPTTAGGPLDTKMSLATPRLDDDSFSRRERQRQQRQQQQQQPQWELPAKPLLQPRAVRVAVPEGAGWQTVARERAVSEIAIDWDEAVTLEELSCSLSSTVEMDTVNVRACCCAC
eukprot:COSAG02_NODE_1375_length_13001_cov_3.495272_7_plen_803_part_00